MPRINFKGFAPETTVTASTPGGPTVSTGLGGWGVPTAQTGTHNAAIEVRRGELRVNPEGVNFDVVLTDFDTPGPVSETNSYDPQFHEVYYFWDFGDPSAPDFTAPINVPDVHKDANRAYGKIASHTYRVAGTYTVSVLVIEPSSGKTAMATVDVTVGDAEALFAGDRTIFVSTDNTFARAPVGAQTVATYYDAVLLQDGLQTNNPTNMYRIMFDREVEHIMQNLNALRENFKNFWLCTAPGAGPLPIIRPYSVRLEGVIWDSTGNNSPEKRTDFTFHDLNLVGYYDVVNETMGGPEADNPQVQGGDVFFNRRGSGHSTYALFTDITASGLNTLHTSTAAQGDDLDLPNMIFNNVVVTDWSNFAVYEQSQGFTAYTGVRFTQNPLSVSGNSKSIGGVEHGPVRLQHCGRCVMHSCDMFSRNGWFENARGIHTPQPCVRWNQNSDPRGKLNMQACAMEGGQTVLALTTQDSNFPTVINNVLIDKTTIVGGSFTGQAIVSTHSGLTVRSSVVIHAGDRTQFGSFEVQPFVGFNARSSDADYLATPNRVYSNTFINHVSDPESSDGNASVAIFSLSNVVGADFSDVVEGNNILHQPNLGTPDTAFAPLSTEVLFPTRYNGYRDYSAIADLTLSGDVADGGSVLLPYANFANTVPSGTTINAAFFDPAPTNARHDPAIYLDGAVQGAVVGSEFTSTVGLSFDATGVTLTNNTGATWPSGGDIRAVLTTAAMNDRPAYGTPAGVIVTGQPQSGSPAIGAATGNLRWIEDFYGVRQPNDTLRTTAGAFEPAS